MTIDWKALCKRAHENAKAKGFLDKARTYHGDTALFHSELSEALEDYRKGESLTEPYYEVRSIKLTKEQRAISTEPPADEVAAWKPCGIPTELADYCIRLAQYSGSNDLDLAEAYRIVQPLKPAKGFEELISRLHLHTSKAYEDFLHSERINEYQLGLALRLLIQFCEDNKIDLEAAITEKEAFNATRSYRHGNKKI